MSANAVRLTLAPVKALDSGKIVTAEEAASLIQDGDTIATGGFVGIGFAEEVALAIETLYLAKGDQPVAASGKPRNLTLVYAGGQGDGNDRGLNHLGHEGLVRRVIDHARRGGDRRIVLDTASDLAAARSLYAAHGFRRTASATGEPFLPAGVLSERWELAL